MEATQTKKTREETAELIMLEWGSCSSCGRPGAGNQEHCTAICRMVIDKINAGMSAEAAVRAHLNPKYDLPAYPAKR